MLIVKTLHIAAAVLWLGNFVVTGVWSIRAFLTRSPELRRFAVREILFTDACFTLIGGALVIMSGLWLASLESIPAWSTRWTRDALVVAVASAMVWLAVLLPLELRMRRLAAAREDAQLVPAFVWWNAWGWIVTLALFFIIYLMVAKPT